MIHGNSMLFLKVFNIDTKACLSSRDGQVILDGNPLRFPPMSLWNTGAKNVVKYLSKLKKSKNILLKGRMSVIGMPGAGKTTIVQSIAGTQAAIFFKY